MKRFYLILMLVACLPALSWSQDIARDTVPAAVDSVQKLSKFQQIKSNITKRIEDGQLQGQHNGLSQIPDVLLQDLQVGRQGVQQL